MNQKEKVLVHLKNEEIGPPKKSTTGSAGLDLQANIKENVVINPAETKLIPTGVAIELPFKKYMALVLARSGLAIKKGITLANGVGLIDSDYRGEINVGLHNISQKPYTVEPGDRIAQLVFVGCEELGLEFSTVLSPSNRGEGGFGSTGR